MSRLSDSQVADLQQRMEVRTEQLRREIAEYQDAASGKDEAAAVAGEGDEADAAFAIASANVDRAQHSRDVVELRDIESARERIQSGDYGVCVDCGVDIEYKRLQASPTAKRCHDCQGIHEQREAGRM